MADLHPEAQEKVSRNCSLYQANPDVWSFPREGGMGVACDAEDTILGHACGLQVTPNPTLLTVLTILRT
jgi:hypothetical protein